MIKTKIYKNAFLKQFALSALCMLLSGNLLWAQKTTSEKTEPEQITVSYKTPFSYELTDAVRWEIINPERKSVKKGSGNIENFTFQQPGNYVLKLTDTTPHNANGCDHQHFPNQLNINVSPYYMAFDLQNVKISRTLTGGSAKGTLVTVNVDFDSFDKKPASYDRGFATAGVGTTIKGKLKNSEISLKPGINTLEFILEGNATTGNYIMMDFTDINGEVQSYGLTQKIQ